MEKVKEIIYAHKFFMRKSQHYVLGDWVEYQDWFVPSQNYTFNKNLWNYYKYFPIAYLKFMYYSIFNPSPNEN